MAIEVLERFQNLTALADRGEEILEPFLRFSSDRSKVPDELRAWNDDVTRARVDYRDLPEPTEAVRMVIDLCESGTGDWKETMTRIRGVISEIRRSAWSPFTSSDDSSQRFVFLFALYNAGQANAGLKLDELPEMFQCDRRTSDRWTQWALERHLIQRGRSTDGDHLLVITTGGIDLVQKKLGELQSAATSARQASMTSDGSTRPMSDPDRKKVFIIHGRNIGARIAVEHFLKALGLQPIDFDQLAADHGGTAFVGDIVRAGIEQAHAIIALFTSDEYAALRPDFRGKHDKPDDLHRWQARPNVIFEAGMAYGFAPTRTLLVTLGTEVALFSDVGGVHIVRLTNNVNSRASLRQKLIGIKCDLDERTTAWIDPARSGDFEACVTAPSEVAPRDPFQGSPFDAA